MVVTEGVALPSVALPGIVKPLGIPPIPARPAGIDGVVGAVTVVLEPIRGKSFSCCKLVTGVPTSTEIDPFESAIDPAGMMKPFACSAVVIDC